MFLCLAPWESVKYLVNSYTTFLWIKGSWQEKDFLSKWFEHPISYCYTNHKCPTRSQNNFKESDLKRGSICFDLLLWILHPTFTRLRCLPHPRLTFLSSYFVARIRDNMFIEKFYSSIQFSIIFCFSDLTLMFLCSVVNWTDKSKKLLLLSRVGCLNP